ncbi:hypothetical protein PMAYCL1PPCAC_19884, partial [Pristionchus mayeri]
MHYGPLPRPMTISRLQSRQYFDSEKHARINSLVMPLRWSALIIVNYRNHRFLSVRRTIASLAMIDCLRRLSGRPVEAIAAARAPVVLCGAATASRAFWPL